MSFSDFRKATIAAAASSLMICAVSAAPMDALVSADHGDRLLRPEVELGYDFANHAVDFLHLRPSDLQGPSGNYSGSHASMGANVLPRLWLDATVWKRNLDYASVTASISSWQLAGQYKVIDGQSTGPSLAVRASAWGDASSELRKTTSAKVQGITFTSARETNPRDHQLQLDAIATMPVTSTVAVSAFAGAGRSQLDFDQVSGTAKIKGCEYDVQLTGERVTMTNPGCQVTRISAPSSVYGIDVNREAAYSATYRHAGVNVAWQGERWRVRGGFHIMGLDRGDVDQVVTERGGQAYRSNRVLIIDGSYKVAGGFSVYLRGQVMSNQFVGEVPMTYNTLTATQHRRRYGFLSLGVGYAF